MSRRRRLNFRVTCHLRGRHEETEFTCNLRGRREETRLNIAQFPFGYTQFPQKKGIRLVAVALFYAVIYVSARHVGNSVPPQLRAHRERARRAGSAPSLVTTYPKDRAKYTKDRVKTHQNFGRRKNRGEPDPGICGRVSA